MIPYRGVLNQQNMGIKRKESELFYSTTFRYLGSFRSKKNKKETSLETAEESLEPVDQKATSPGEAQGTQEPCDQKAVIEEVISKEVKQGELEFKRPLIRFKFELIPLI